MDKDMYSLMSHLDWKTINPEDRVMFKINRNKNTNKYNSLLNPKQIIFNNPATIVVWEDGTKTVVKTMEGDTFNEEYGVAMAYMKKIFGSSNKFKRTVKKFIKEEKI